MSGKGPISRKITLIGIAPSASSPAPATETGASVENTPEPETSGQKAIEPTSKDTERMIIRALMEPAAPKAVYPPKRTNAPEYGKTGTIRITPSVIVEKEEPATDTSQRSVPTLKFIKVQRSVEEEAEAPKNVEQIKRLSNKAVIAIVVACSALAGIAGTAIVRSISNKSYEHDPLQDKNALASDSADPIKQPAASKPAITDSQVPEGAPDTGTDSNAITTPSARADAANNAPIVQLKPTNKAAYPKKLTAPPAKENCKIDTQGDELDDPWCNKK